MVDVECPLVFAVILGVRFSFAVAAPSVLLFFFFCAGVFLNIVLKTAQDMHIEMNGGELINEIQQ